MAKLAFYTYGILEEKIPHPQNKEFLNRALGIYESITHSEGFIGRADSKTFEDESFAWGDPGASPRFTGENLESRPDDAASDSPDFPGIPRGYDPATISLWDDLESVYAYAYNGRHMEALKKRSEWFVNPEWPTYVAWWVEDGETPTREDAASRLEHLHDKGSTPNAFDFKTPFDAAGTPWKMDRSKIQERAKTVKAFDEDNPQNL